MLLGEKWKFIRNLFGIMHYYFKIQKSNYEHFFLIYSHIFFRLVFMN